MMAWEHAGLVKRLRLAALAGVSLAALSFAAAAQDGGESFLSLPTDGRISIVPVAADRVSLPLDTDAARFRVSIPPGPLEPALTALAKQIQLKLAYQTTLTEGLATQGADGEFRPLEALAKVLDGTGLTYRAAGPSTITLVNPRYVQLGSTPADAVTLDEISVAGEGGRPAPAAGLPPPTGVIGQPPPPYAGGQVASGTRVGLLGNQSVFNTPFNITGYTDKLIRDQQSRAIADVVLNDPSVQLATPRGGPQDQFVIRGFRTFQQDILFDGLGGLVDIRRPAIDNVERVEILKGPSALLNGVTVNGNIGALINFIPKRATDAPITRYTVGYASRAEFGNYVDIGRRFGPNNEWGIRFNGSYRNGPGEIDRASTEWGFAGLGLDYRGERLRASIDAGIQKQEADPFIALRLVAPGFQVPRAPRARTNIDQPWEFSHTNHRFISTRIEYDLTVFQSLKCV